MTKRQLHALIVGLYDQLADLALHLGHAEDAAACKLLSERHQEANAIAPREQGDNP